MSSYSAVVCKIKTRRHPTAERIALGDVYGYQVVVGIDTADGALGVFCPCDGKLSEAFVTANDLAPRYDEEHNRIGGGFFEAPNYRIRAQKFRGEKSEGYWFPLWYLTSYGSAATLPIEFFNAVHALKEGDQFTSLGGVEICSKYETQATRMAGLANRQKQPKKSKDNPLFKKHSDTAQFRHESFQIPVGSIVHISLKMHGTSGRYAFLSEEAPESDKMKKIREEYVKKNGTFLSSLRAFSFERSPSYSWRNFVGSRNVQLKEGSSGGYYGDDTFRYDVLKKLSGVRKGETVYLEIVGYLPNGKSIMAKHSNTKLNDKGIVKQYGDTMDYSYGCLDGQNKCFVYRITQTNDDGYVTELTVPQVKARCEEMGVDYVYDFVGPLVVTGKNDSGVTVTGPDASCNGGSVDLAGLVATLCEGPDPVGLSHVREGVVVRVDAPDGRTYFLKEKGLTFKILEGIVKDSEDYVDLEESA